MKIDSIYELQEFLDARLGEDCYIRDYMIIGHTTYFIYESEDIERLKSELLDIFSNYSSIKHPGDSSGP